jgi:putative selenate reductase molybdopterin-binding subunit
MKLTLRINQKDFQIEVRPEEKLLGVLRQLGFLGAKSGGCVKGECGACTVLMDGNPINSCMFFAVQAQGHEIETIENAGQHPQQGWKQTDGYSILQQVFIESGSVQCGYCTPAMILAAKALLDKNPDPTEAEVRDALSGVLCRCTAYVKPVQAILAAAEKIRRLAGLDGTATDSSIYEPEIFTLDQREATATIGKSEIKLDAAKLVQGKPAFTADWHLPGMLYAKVLASPYAHARIKSIDASLAKALEGVAAV